MTSDTGRLTIVGTGIRAGLQTTPEARARIESAQKVLYLESSGIAGNWVTSLNSSAQSLAHFYEPGKPRSEIYEAMVEEILSWVRRGLDVCVVFYGHPGLLVYPSHEALKRARHEGFPARMLPGVSSEDMLIAELEFDPGESGCQSYDATTFLLHQFKFDPRAALILFQIYLLGDMEHTQNSDSQNLPVLVKYLQRSYGPDHEIVIYVACPYPVGDSSIQRLRLEHLPQARLQLGSTLYVPPKNVGQPDPEMCDRLGLELG
jgi:Tetrapyrrole (Corrin/Porphyrin) Methylases